MRLLVYCGVVGVLGLIVGGVQPDKILWLNVTTSEVARSLLVLAGIFAAGYVVEHIVTEAFTPRIVASVGTMGKDLAGSIGSLADRLEPTIREGFQTIGSSLSSQMGKTLETVMSRSDAWQTKKDTSTAETAEIQRLISAGNLGEADRRLLTLLAGDHATDEVIRLFVKSRLAFKDPAKSEEALKILEDYREKFSERPIYWLAKGLIYASLSLRDKALTALREAVAHGSTDLSILMGSGVLLHEIGDPLEAIRVTESALRLTEQRRDTERAARLKSNLAYYYSNLRLNREQALQYAKEALEELPDRAPQVDTMGFVKIVWGQTVAEVEEGLSLVEKAAKLGAPADYTEKHRSLAIQRLTELRTKGP